ncbi:unnamed protein product, partial [Closterium sp. NIES-65]
KGTEEEGAKEEERGERKGRERGKEKKKGKEKAEGKWRQWRREESRNVIGGGSKIAEEMRAEAKASRDRGGLHIGIGRDVLRRLNITLSGGLHIGTGREGVWKKRKGEGGENHSLTFGYDPTAPLPPIILSLLPAPPSSLSHPIHVKSSLTTLTFFISPNSSLHPDLACCQGVDLSGLKRRQGGGLQEMPITAQEMVQDSDSEDEWDEAAAASYADRKRPRMDSSCTLLAPLPRSVPLPLSLPLLAPLPLSPTLHLPFLAPLPLPPTLLYLFLRPVISCTVHTPYRPLLVPLFIYSPSPAAAVAGRLLGEFEDVLGEEKGIMHRWMAFVRRHRVIADRHVPWACEAFAITHKDFLSSSPCTRM